MPPPAQQPGQPPHDAAGHLRPAGRQQAPHAGESHEQGEREVGPEAELLRGEALGQPAQQQRGGSAMKQKDQERGDDAGMEGGGGHRAHTPRGAWPGPAWEKKESISPGDFFVHPSLSAQELSI